MKTKTTLRVIWIVLVALMAFSMVGFMIAPLFGV